MSQKPGQSEDLAEAVKDLAKEPPSYAVMLYNDDYTTMEFVVEVLMRFFSKTEAQAHTVMLKVHQEGRGVAGIYHFEIAETKVQQVRDAARKSGFPLKCEAERMDP